MNACVIKEQVLWGTVDIVQAHMQKVIEVNILILTILIAVFLAFLFFFYLNKKPGNIIKQLTGHISDIVIIFQIIILSF